MQDKINLLVGSWLGKKSHDLILHRLSSIHQTTHRYFPLLYTNLPCRADIVSLDYRHWLFDDETFFAYIKHACTSIQSSALCLGEDVFGYEMPRGLELRDYAKKVNERFQTISHQIRTDMPTIKILSPAIRLLEGTRKDAFLDFMVHGRHLFDIYAVHCCYDLTDRNIGSLSGLLNEILEVAHKPVWITNWFIPSCQHQITSSHSLAPTSWKPTPHAEAIAKTRQLFTAINNVAQGDTKWFFTGAGEDIYHPNKFPPGFWDDTSIYRMSDLSRNWNQEHFGGLITYNGEVKEKIIRGLLDLYHANS